MSSGPIILLIVALWAAVLIPAVLRRRDEVTETKSVARFTRAMRTLRRDDVLPADDPTVLMPRRPAASVAPHLFSKSDGVRRVTAAIRPATARAASRPAASGAAAARPAASRASAIAGRNGAGRGGRRSPLRARRVRAVRTLGVAVGATLLVGIAVGGLAWMVHGLVDGAAVVYVIHLRAEAKRAVDLARRRPRVSASGDRRDVGAPTTDWTEAAAPAAAAGDAEQAPQRHQVSFDDGQSGATPADAAAVISRAWQPVPVPVPTYVTAPKAPRRGKQIEVPPSWSDGLRDDDVTIDLASLDRVDPEIDRLLDRRRAVND